MPDTSHIHIRPLEIGDFNFVRELASRQRNFTIPPVYVLWLMLRIKGAISLVAEHSSEGPVAYLLAVPITAPAESIFIWQLAASKGAERVKATLTLLGEFQKIASELAVRTIVFSSVPDSPAFRTIRRLAWTVFSSTPEALHTLPISVNAKESEYQLTLHDISNSGKSHAATK
jgi:hypothetical protein